MAVELAMTTFEPHVGDPFEVSPAEGEPFELVLTSCEASPYSMPPEDHPVPGRIPFSLFFHSDDGDRFWPQQIFTMRHAALGEFELFLVPLGPDEGRMRYEAAVN